MIGHLIDTRRPAHYGCIWFIIKLFTIHSCIFSSIGNYNDEQ